MLIPFPATQAVTVQISQSNNKHWSQQNSNQSIASHPTSDPTIASNEQLRIISELKNDTKASAYLPENDERDAIVEFKNTSESVANEQAGYTCYRTTRHAMQIAIKWSAIHHTLPHLTNFGLIITKSKQLKSHEDYTKLDKLLATLQKAILTERTSLMQSIANIEHPYFQQHAAISLPRI